MNWADYVIIALIVSACIAGLLRGLLREGVALLTWIVGLYLAWSYSGLIESQLGGALSAESVRPWAARTVIFLAVLLLGTLIGLLVSHFVRLSIFAATDSFFGGVFGCIRGLVMVGVLVMLCHAVRLENEPWWRASVLVPYAERGANVLRALVGERKIQTGPELTTAR
jgi:membrane protein required for colicin V production